MPRRFRESEVTLALPAEGDLRIAVIADTHSRAHAEAAPLIAKREPHHILHAGDIGDEAVLVPFERIATTTVVRGNIDPVGRPDAVSIGIDGLSDGFSMLLTHIAVNGPKLRADAVRRAQKYGAAMVVCGHSHVPFIGRDRGLTMFNPGSIGPRRFRLPITFGMIHIGAETLSLEHVDCETGERWEP